MFVSVSMANQNDFLEPDDAFKLSFSQNENSLTINMDLGRGIYAYKDKLHIKIIEPTKQDLNSVLELPRTQNYHDRDVFKKNFQIHIALDLIKKYAKSDDFSIEVSWQGCSEDGICYQPMSKIFNSSTKDSSKHKTIADSLSNKGVFWILASFFGFGLLLALTPCVFPMIPILSSIIVSQSHKQMSVKRGFFLSLIYVLAMSFSYAFAGVLAGLFGANIQAVFQNSYVIFAFSGVFVLLSLSMFGLYELTLPKSLQTIVSKKSQNAQGRGILGIAIMGFLSALIVSPCVAAPLAGALIYIGQSGDWLLGGLALFVMGLGMGMPLLLIGASAGKLLPKPGLWMDRVKNIFGVLMLGIAIWMIQRVVSNEISMFLWAFLLISSAIYMGIFDNAKSGWDKLLKSFAFIVLLYGVLLFAGSFIGGGSVLSPLKGIHTNNAPKIETNNFVDIKSLDELNKIISTSKKPIMVDFWASWCVSCKEMEETFKTKEVASFMNDFLLVRADVTKNTAQDTELLKRFNLFGPPAIVFFKNKKELRDFQIVGFRTPSDFLSILKMVDAQ